MSSLSVSNLIEEEDKLPTKSGLWSCNQDVKERNIVPIKSGQNLFLKFQSITTSISDLWLLEKLIHDRSITFTAKTKNLFINDLGWTREQIIETRSRLKSFEKDWDRPEMDIYDKL